MHLNRFWNYENVCVSLTHSQCCSQCRFHLCSTYSFRNGSGSPKPGLIQVSGGDRIVSLNVRRSRHSGRSSALAQPLKIPGVFSVIGGFSSWWVVLWMNLWYVSTLWHNSLSLIGCLEDIWCLCLTLFIFPCFQSAMLAYCVLAVAGPQLFDSASSSIVVLCSTETFYILSSLSKYLYSLFTSSNQPYDLLRCSLPPFASSTSASLPLFASSTSDLCRSPAPLSPAHLIFVPYT